MQTVTIELPTLYGDHHVTEVRRILLDIAGVVEVYASSCFQVVEISFEPERVSEAELTAALEKAGYLGEWANPVEAQSNRFQRHSAAYENLRQGVSFAQTVTAAGRPLWPCPGMGQGVPQVGPQVESKEG